MAAKKKAPTKKQADPVALAEPRSVCPFTGGALTAWETSAGWQVRGPGWHSTSFYPSKEIALWHFSHTGGVPPAYPNPLPSVQVGEETSPPLPTAADAAADAEKMGDKLADEAQADFEKEQA